MRGTVGPREAQSRAGSSAQWWQQQRARALSLALVVGAALLSCAGSARAQTWSSARGGPALWQITSLDRTGEPGWPYGAEDIAGDGAAAFAVDEAGADLRSVYADANAQRLWLRAYVAGTTGPLASLVTFFFIDTDQRGDTGGAAQGAALDPTLSDDPTRGGYERAFGVRGDGRVLGAWAFGAQERAWLSLTLAPAALRAEAGRARDPLALFGLEHGYVQVDLEHALSGLDASCGGTIFVRTRNVAVAPRAFGDDDRAGTCRVAPDAYGDPVILRSFTCHLDAECPIGGRCREGVCLFAYDCATAADCPSGTRCADGRCVRAVEQSCTTRADCSGLVCEGSACVACSDVGQRTCGGELSCSPNGTCVDPGAFEPGAGESGVGKVQGGAFSCATLSVAHSRSVVFGWALALFLLARRRVRRSRSPSHVPHGEGRRS